MGHLHGPEGGADDGVPLYDAIAGLDQHAAPAIVHDDVVPQLEPRPCVLAARDHVVERQAGKTLWPGVQGELRTQNTLTKAA